MSTSSSQLAADIAQLHADAGLMHSVIHGDAATTVATEGGPIPSVAKAVNAIAAFTLRGPWVTATAYAFKDVYTDASGLAYMVLLPHVSTTIAADLATGKVGVYQGIPPSEFANRLSVTIDSVSALRALSKAVYSHANVTDYGFGVGGGGEYVKKYDVAPSGWENGGSQIVSADGAGWQLKLNGPIRFQHFGAKGNNVDDDWPPCSATVAFCEATQTQLHISEASYLLGQQLVLSGTFDITCDNTAAMRWNNKDSCGILGDFEDSNDTLTTINLPQLFSPAISSDFKVPGYNNNGDGVFNYDLSTRTGNAFHLRGGNRININAHYAAGWSSCFQAESTQSATVANVNFTINTIDFCVKGFTTYAEQPNSLGVVALVCKANTAWAKYPIYIDGTNQYLVASRFAIEGQAFVNEVDGAGIYGQSVDSKVDTCMFDINWLSAGHAADSTTGTPAGLVCPFLAGSASSNGLTIDGNSTLGYWSGKFCTFRIGPVMGIPGGKSASAVPTAGDTIRIRDVGPYNSYEMLNSQSVFVAPIATTTTMGEANYNGGVGGAQYAKRVLCQATIPALAPFATSVNHYVYHQCVSRAANKLVRVTPIDGGFAADALSAIAACDASANNRQIKIQFTNTSATRTSTAKTVYFVLEYD